MQLIVLQDLVLHYIYI